ncbi:MAG: acyl-CoA thioesterase [Muribaculaceae bacterium]|nr:acyl-CoA thioesterase [Muribaculaceae bacterium]
MIIPSEQRTKYCFILEMDVRDYELDCEQIVNNANYLHYMEHARHIFCREAGFPFIEMHEQGIDAVVRKIDIEYISPLKSGDSFTVGLSVGRQGPKFIFVEDIFKKDGSIIAKATITCVVTKNGKPTRGNELSEYFSPYFT